MKGSKFFIRVVEFAIGVYAVYSFMFSDDPAGSMFRMIMYAFLIGGIESTRAFVQIYRLGVKSQADVKLPEAFDAAAAARVREIRHTMILIYLALSSLASFCIAIFIDMQMNDGFSFFGLFA